MNEPLPGQKTNITAAAFTILQALVLSGLVPAELAEHLSMAFAGVFGVTLALKGIRSAKKGA